MNCPKCNQSTITFKEWFGGFNAVRWTCPHCQERLKANRITIYWLIGTGVAMLVVLVASLGLVEMLGITESTGRMIFGAGLFGVVYAGAGLAWKTGGYDSRSQ